MRPRPPNVIGLLRHRRVCYSHRVHCSVLVLNCTNRVECRVLYLKFWPQLYNLFSFALSPAIAGILHGTVSLPFHSEITVSYYWADCTTEYDTCPCALEFLTNSRILAMFFMSLYLKVLKSAWSSSPTPSTSYGGSAGTRSNYPLRLLETPS